MITSLANRTFAAGPHTVTWNAENSERGKLPSGVYFVKFDTGNYRSTQKVILNK